MTLVQAALKQKPLQFEFLLKAYHASPARNVMLLNDLCSFALPKVDNSIGSSFIDLNRHFLDQNRLSWPPSHDELQTYHSVIARNDIISTSELEQICWEAYRTAPEDARALGHVCGGFSLSAFSRIIIRMA